MTQPHTNLLPNERWLFGGIGLLFAVSLIAVLYGRLTDVGGTTEELPTLREARLLVFEDTDGGDIAIRDAETLTLIASYTTGEGGFARTALRSLAYTRRLNGIGATDPFLLAEANDGRILLHDPSTRQTIGINAFGAANIEQFSFLLEEEENPQ